MSRDVKKITELNDAWRAPGSMMIETGMHALCSDFVDQAIHAAHTYTDFNPDNDPHDERDFAIEGQKLYWQIEYRAKAKPGEKYSRQLSGDPADPKKTDRVTTVMLTKEY